MTFTRRQALTAIAGSAALRAQDVPSAPAANLPMAVGKFKPDDESFKQYRYPDWFRDAKFGMWAHWGPQAVPRQGDWYAKRMYQHDATGRGGAPRQDPANQYHLEHYGHPSKFGYKDIVPLWKAEKWNPEQLMALYKKAGAKYFVSMGTHHDNFFLWDSKLHRWNAVQMGPKKDVVGLWQLAVPLTAIVQARSAGMPLNTPGVCAGRESEPLIKVKVV